MPLLAANLKDGDVVIEWAIAAGRNAVWASLTNPDAMTAWLGTPSVAEIRPGGNLIVDHGGGYSCQSTVHEVENEGRFALSWHFPDEHETGVLFELTDTEFERPDVGCQLTLRHSQLGALAESYRVGWTVHLTYLEAKVHGDPIPTSQFWNLHATLHQLSSAEHDA